MGDSVIQGAKIAVGIGANVTILDLSAKRLGYLDDIFGSSLQTLYSNKENIIKCLKFQFLPEAKKI